ncbi:c-type cytochrome [Thiocystis violacea]|uniref:c-type cytochrome n=1 Tax=Thiocystis violacea TaxID=13725 RepID=UPI00190326C5|nr:cytochrome c [Thiocystis violacea]MBK1719407.1 green heme protein [Thiocystis violacea]
MNRKFHSRAVAPAAALMLAALTPVQASENAETLYQAHCIKCHGSEIYTREDRKVTSLEGLERQVQRCELSLGLQWFDEDIADVATYLNQHYYQFAR